MFALRQVGSYHRYPDIKSNTDKRLTMARIRRRSSALSIQCHKVVLRVFITTTSSLWSLVAAFSVVSRKNSRPPAMLQQQGRTVGCWNDSSGRSPGSVVPTSNTEDHLHYYKEMKKNDEMLMDLVPDGTLTNEEFLKRNSDQHQEFDVPSALLKLPRHSDTAVNEILMQTESVLQTLQRVDGHNVKSYSTGQPISTGPNASKNINEEFEGVFANNYVDLGSIDIVGFDYDYTLVTYTDALLDLIYDLSLSRLVTCRQYPDGMLEAGMKYDPFFSIRGLAVDKETGWITHLSYTHKVAVAWEGREKLPSSRIFEEYRGKRALNPSDRKKRLKPLNDLFSMAECCLIADTIQFFKDHHIPFSPQNVVNDVLKVVTETHISGDFHRMVAADLDQYLTPTPYLEQVLDNLKASGKRLIFVSNSPFWYVDAGMRHLFGEAWRDQWDAVITSKSSRCAVYRFGIVSQHFFFL